MLPVAIVSLILAIAAGFATTEGTGAMFFATGFAIIAVVAALQFMRSRTPTVF